MSIGRQIRRRRKILGITQEHLAKELDMKVSTLEDLEDIEEERRNPGSTTIRTAARVLNTTTAYLLGETIDPESGAKPQTDTPLVTISGATGSTINAAGNNIVSAPQMNILDLSVITNLTAQLKKQRDIEAMKDAISLFKASIDILERAVQSSQTEQVVSAGGKML